MLKQTITTTNAQVFFSNCVSDDCGPWQLKILEDKQLIETVLLLPESSVTWNLFGGLASHSGVCSFLLYCSLCGYEYLRVL